MRAFGIVVFVIGLTLVAAGAFAFFSDIDSTPWGFVLGVVLVSAAFVVGGRIEKRIAAVIIGFPVALFLLALARSDKDLAIIFAACLSLSVAGTLPFKDVGETALHRAAKLGRTDKVQRLLAREPNTNAKDGKGRTPLHYAATDGRTAVVGLLLANGADVNAKTKKGETPLHCAAQRGHKETVELLLSRGAAVNATDRLDRTPLHTAAINDEGEVAELLREHGGRFEASR
jgi:ankyrin repeat protein